MAFLPRRQHARTPRGAGMSAEPTIEKSTFFRLLGAPWLLLVLSLVPVGLLALGLADVRKDPSVDAFSPADHPAALTREKSKEIFGLEDPIVIAFAAPDGASIFTPAYLDAIDDFARKANQVPGVSRGRIVSPTDEAAIRGENGDLFVDAIWEGGGADDAALAWTRIQSMPMLIGTLVSADGTAAMVIVPVERPDNALEETRALYALAAETAAASGLEVHLAGVATMNARLSEMVTSDTMRFVPGVFVIVIVTMWMALRRLTPLVGPLMVIAGSAIATIGAMGLMDSRYYLITTALPVVVVTIAVTDSIHLTFAYLRERRRAAGLSRRHALSHAMRRTALPITITSVTTALGFFGLSLGTAMVPISEFGLYAALGVIAAWLLSLSVLPALILLTQLEPVDGGPAQPGRLDAFLTGLSRMGVQRPVMTLSLFGVFCALLVTAGFRAEFDYQRKAYFQSGDDVRIADQLINERFDGGNFLDVLVSAPEEGGLVTSEAITKVAALQDRLERINGVRKVTSIADYVALMHERLHEEPSGRLPEARNAPAQYLLLYETSGDPGDFDEEIDYTYQTALIRAQLDSDSFQNTRGVVDEFIAVAEAWSSESELSAEVGGRIAVNDGWMTELANTHFVSLAMAFLFVTVGTVAMFRSVWLGVLAAFPMLSGIALVYAAMGMLGIDIAPATSMCAALATGLGVDFGVHLGKEIRSARRAGHSLEAAIGADYALVAKACVLSALSLSAGFMVVLMSEVPVLRWFGFLLAAATIGSLIGALFAVPALSALAQKREVSRAPQFVDA